MAVTYFEVLEERLASHFNGSGDVVEMRRLCLELRRIVAGKRGGRRAREKIISEYAVNKYSN
jgi:hypothetical protein